MLAPMAGISDLPYRLINRRFGCELAFTEMISARALTRYNANTLNMLATDPADRQLGVQLLGNDPEIMVRAIDIMQSIPVPYDIIDINAACPVSKVTKKGEGAALLRDPKKLYEILKAVVKTGQTPVTVKIRAGWDEESVNARDIAMLAQDAGVNAVIIHGRTQSQGYSGKVDYEEIRKVKESLNIPVVASGDAFSARLIKNIFKWTNCDGVAIARGALGNPWIFRETEHYLKFGELPVQHDLNELVDNMLFHLEMAISADGELEGTKKFRKFFAWYVRGLHEARAFKARAFSAETQEQMAGLIDELKTSYFRTRSVE